MRILVVEDDPICRTSLCTLLLKASHEVVSVSNGEEAIQTLNAKDAPRLVILDRLMPGIDGIEVCRRIRAKNLPDPPYIIILTVMGEKMDIVTGLQAGANDYLPKPYSPAELSARVEVGCRMLSLQSQLIAQADELRTALEQVKTLRGIIPICANCKRIRDDSGYWAQVESYLSKHSDAEFTHGMCPECIRQFYPEEAAAENETEEACEPPAFMNALHS